VVMLDHDLDEIFYYVRPYDWFDVHPSGCNEWETAKKLIKEAIAKVEKRARVRKLPTHLVMCELDESIKKHPYGLAGAEGGRVPRSYEYWADTTYLFLSWYTWRRKKSGALDNVS